MDERDPITLFSIAFGLSSVAGLAALLRNGRALTWRLILSAALNSGLFGIGVAMIWYNYYGGAQHPWFMLGVSLLAGLGGASLIDLCYTCVQNGIKNYFHVVSVMAAQRTGAFMDKFNVKPEDQQTPKPGDGE